MVKYELVKELNIRGVSYWGIPSREIGPSWRIHFGFKSFKERKGCRAPLVSNRPRFWTGSLIDGNESDSFDPESSPTSSRDRKMQICSLQKRNPVLKGMKAADSFQSVVFHSLETAVPPLKFPKWRL